MSHLFDLLGEINKGTGRGSLPWGESSSLENSFIDSSLLTKLIIDIPDRKLYKIVLRTINCFIEKNVSPFVKKVDFTKPKKNSFHALSLKNYLFPLQVFFCQFIPEK